MKSNIDLEYKPEDRFVAFIDVLGFSKMVSDDGSTGVNLKIIKQAIEDASLPLEKRGRNLSSVRILVQEISGHGFNY